MNFRGWMVVAGALALGACQDAVTGVDGPGAPAGPPAASVQLDSGYVMRDGSPMRVVFEVRGGRAVFEGDIDLGPAGEIAKTVEEARRREQAQVEGEARLGVVTSNLSRRWGYGQVPYVIESTVPNQSRITSAIAHIEANVHGVDFVPRTSHGSWIIFRRTTDPNICGQSPLGRQGGGQVVLINDNCGSGTAIHEILHSLGFWHEQSRCDRDSYVEILWNNIQSGRSDQFNAYCSGANTVYAYDEGSIMHYGPTAFGKIVNGVPLQTIRSRRGLDYLMGQRSGLSTQDIYTVDWMYRPYAPSGVADTYPGNMPTISWNAYPTATEYSVELVAVYEEWDYERGYSTHEYTERWLGNTTGLSMQDAGATYTGNQYCDVYYSNYTTAYYTYWYQVVAHLPSGVVSYGARTPAYISTC